MIEMQKGYYWVREGNSWTVVYVARSAQRYWVWYDDVPVDLEELSISERASLTGPLQPPEGDNA